MAVEDDRATFTSGPLTAGSRTDGPWNVTFEAGGRVLTSSGARSIGVVTDADERHFVHEQLSLGVGEHVYGLGERFGAVRQERPGRRHLERGRRHRQRAGLQERPLLPDQPRLRRLRRPPGHVSFEVGSEVVSRAQFRVEGADAGVLRHPRPDAEGRAAPLHRADRPPGAGAGLVVRTVALDLVHDQLRRGDRDARSSTAWPSATCRCRVFHFDCFWMRAVPLVRLRLGPGDVPRPGGHAAAPARHAA